MRRVCYAGTYERDYPRNSLMIQAFRDAGVRVEECHQPVFESSRDKSELHVIGLAVLLVRLTLAYLRLIPDVGLRLLRCDALVVGYIGQLDMLVLGSLAKAAGRPVVFNPLVSLSDTLVDDRRRFRPGSLPARAIRVIDRLSMGMADVVLADTEDNAEYFAAQSGLDSRRFAVVQVGAPEDVFYPARSGGDRTGNLDVLFVGKFIPLHGVETILHAAAILQERGAQVTIEMVGTGQDYRPACSLAGRLGLTNVVWTEWIAFGDLGDRLRTADVVLGIFDDGPKASRVIPNKVHQALACGVALVTRESPAVDRFLTDGVSAMLVPPADPDALAVAIERLGNDDVRRAIGRAGHESWLTWGACDRLADQADEALGRLAASR